MALEQLLGAIPSVAGGLLGTGINILGGDMAARAQKRAQARARTDLMKGYGQGMGFQQPIYDQSLGNFTDLSADYGSGKFDNGKVSPFEFDPQSVFQDPEYQASMRAGTEAINSGAQAKGKLFSGTNDRDLNQFGQDVFAGRSDALYKRGFDAENTAFDQNALTNQTNFNQGLALTTPLAGAAGKLTDLSVGQGQDLANNSTGSGIIRANNIQNTTGALTDLTGNLVNAGSNLLNSTGVKQPASARK